MAQQTLNIPGNRYAAPLVGTDQTPDTGESWHSALTKIEANFADLYGGAGGGGGTEVPAEYTFGSSYFGLEARGIAFGATSTQDLFLTRKAAASLQIGAADAAAPVAQSISAQSVVTGTTNTAGAALTINGSQGTGTGAGGAISFRTAPAGSSGSTPNALANALVINADRTVTIGDSGGSAGKLTIGIGMGHGLYLGTRGSFGATGDGVFQMRDNAGTGFDRLAFGGSTTSFPAIKRSSAILQARLADDSAYTTIDAQLRAQGTAPANASATGTAGDIRYDADYIYICTATNTWKRAAIATW